MSTPQHSAAEPAPAPTVSTAPTGGEPPPERRGWWHRSALPDHLGRARTSTVVLSLLFLAVFALYLNVRPDPGRTGTSPAGGSSDVEAPANPIVPSEPTEEPVPSAEPEGTTGTDEGTSTTAPTTPSSGPGDTPETSTPPGTTDGSTGRTTEPDAPTTTSAPTP